MHSALYYPHTTIRSTSLVRTALLTWDRLEWIVPFHGFPREFANRDIAEAMEIIGTPRVPDDQEKGATHDFIEDMLKAGVLDTFKYEPAHGRGEQDYGLWSAKLAHRTWDLLGQAGLVGGHLDNRDYPASQAAGLTLMSILADVMAGTTRARVTDRSLAYVTIANAPGMAPPAGDAGLVVPLTFKSIAVEHIPMHRLIDLRKREAREHGDGLRNLRHAYLAAVEEHLAAIQTVRFGSRDRIELDRVFEQKMDDDLRELKRELGFAKREAWLDANVISLVLGGAALLANAFGHHLPLPEVLNAAGLPVTIGGVMAGANKFSKSRQAVMAKHPMAYLYELDRRR